MILFWKWIFTGSSSAILLPLVAASLLVFTAECKLLVFHVIMLLQSRGWNCGKLKMSPSSSLLPKFSCIFRINVAQDAANLCSISRALKKLIITVSAIFLVVKEKRICGDPYFAFSFFLSFLFADVYWPHLFLYQFICVENHGFIEILPTSVQHQRINSSVLHL